MRVCLVANPRAGGGRARARISEVARHFERLGATCQTLETRGPREATRLAREARSEGVDVVAVMGGDGTFSEAAQAWVDSSGQPVEGPALGLIPFGTGGDFRRNFELGHDIEEAVSRVVHGQSRTIDMARVTLKNHQSQTVSHCFINVGSFGISGLAAHLVNSGSKLLGGKAAFYWSSVRATLGYRNVPVRISVDGKPLHEGRTYLGAFANGRYFGGGMKIAPDACLDDGLLDCIVLGDFSRLSAITQTPRVYAGTHLQLDGAKSQRGRHFEVTTWLDDSDALIELDGETPGQLPMTIEVVPRALELRI